MIDAKNWIEIKDYHKNEIYRGSYFLFNTKYPFEDRVIMMLCQNKIDEEYPSFLITITGNKAGIFPYCVLPKECLNKDTISVNTNWLINNWNKWVNEETALTSLYIKSNLDISEIDIILTE